MRTIQINGQPMTLEEFQNTSDLTVRGGADLSGYTELTRLPDNLTVMGELYLDGCPGLTHLPDNLAVGRALILSNRTGLTNIYRGGRDERRYDFYGVKLKNGPRVIAGCRNFSAEEARRHWVENPECLALAEDVIAHFGQLETG